MVTRAQGSAGNRAGEGVQLGPGGSLLARGVAVWTREGKKILTK